MEGLFGMKNRNLRKVFFYNRNTAEVNASIANLLAYCSAVILILAALSALGFFEFGRAYTGILLIGGLFVCLKPKLLIRVFPDRLMQYSMIFSVALFVGILGFNKNIGIYITYALVPILSCLYFDPAFVLKSSALSYVFMLVSLYGTSADMAEVVYQGIPRMQMFFASAAGFTVEFAVVTAALYALVKRANRLTLENSDAERALRSSEKERQMLNALCVNFTAAYVCDLMTDYIRPIKQKDFSHAVSVEEALRHKNSYAEWVRYNYTHIVVRDASPDYPDVYDAKKLMQRLTDAESFTYRHKTLPNAAGMQYFEATFVRMYTDDRHFRIIIGYRPIDDIVAEEKQRREQLETALEAARRSAAAKTNFLRRMSHDIRTPLNGIIGLLKIGELHPDDVTLLAENREKMQTAADHLLSLINDILQMSKLEDGSFVLAHERISLYDLTQDIVSIIIDRAEESGIAWDYEKGKSVIPYPYVYGSPLHLRQIFLNIYGNCIKYNRPGGKITTIVDTLDERAGYCTYRWRISDTGIGMSEEFLSHIFEPFSQEKNDARSVYNGTGLGMSIVKSLLDRMDGKILVTSKLGVGTTFEIIIPFEIAPAPAAEPMASTQTREADIRGLHLLLAEDNELNAEIAVALLRDAGADVTAVRDGKQAVERFAHSAPGTFDAILMDVMMPVMDGLEATKAIRALGRPDAAAIPIIAMTANAFAEDASDCFAAGMNAHLAKPLDIVKFKTCIYAQTAGRKRRPPQKDQ